jgi:REP element-mobilizing transposase RayT
MARPLRIQEPGLTYHVHARGNGKMTIFLDDQDRRKFLEIFEDVADVRRLECCALCLMATHYHLVVRTLDPNLSRAMRDLNGHYAQWWNRRHGHVGHVFQSRYGSQIVQDEGYLVTACRYVVLNPVRAGIVSAPEEWRWSSYRATAGLEPVPAFLRLEILLTRFGTVTEEAIAMYRQYVAAARDGAAGTLARDPILGESTFIARFNAWRERASIEVPARERRPVRPPLERLFARAVSRRVRDARVLAAYRLGCTMAEIARRLQLHYGTVSKIVRRGVRSRKKGKGKT